MPVLTTNLIPSEDLDSFLERNGGIDNKTFKQVFYHCLLQDAAFKICEDKIRGKEDDIRNKIRSLGEKYVINSLLEGYNLTSQESEFISSIISAYIHKQNSRLSDISKISDQLYKSQKGKCNCCDKSISKEDCAIDHVFPFKYTGDSYQMDRYQLLCKKCNLEKSADPWFPIRFYTKYQKLPKYVSNE